jgi:hypothetical protein
MDESPVGEKEKKMLVRSRRLVLLAYIPIEASMTDNPSRARYPRSPTHLDGFAQSYDW